MATSMAPLAQMIMELGRTGEKMQESFQRGREIRRAEEEQALKREQLLRQAEMQEEMYPYQLQKLRGEAAMAGQPKMTEKARQVQELVNEGIQRQTAVAQVYGTERTYTDPQTGNIVSYNPLESYFTELGAKTPEQQAQATEIMGAEERGEIEPVDTIGMMEQPTADVPPGGRVVARGTKEEERREAEKQNIDKGVQDLAKRETDSGIVTLGTSLDTLEGRVKNTLPDDIEGVGADARIFGRGGIISNAVKGIPGAGEAVDAIITEPLRKFFISDEGKKTQMAAKNAAAQYMKMLSGADVTDEEREYYMSALGQTDWSNPKEFLYGIQIMREAHDAIRGSIRAGYSDEVVSEYERRRQRELGRDKPKEKPESKDFDPSQATDIADNPETGETLYKYNGQWVDAQGNPHKPKNNADKGQEGMKTPEAEAQQAQDPTQQALGILQNELAKGTSKQAVLNTLNEMKADGTIDMKQYRKIVRELQLGTFDTFKSSRRYR